MVTMPTRGTVFDLQRFCIHDGPGIRTVIFFKGCPLHCLWCQNPEGLDAEPEISFSADRCLGCQECRRACPLQAISFEGAGRINRELCDRCGKCVEVCQSGALEIVGRLYTPEELLAEARDDMPFFVASGGGITLSGGEPTCQAGFLAGFLPLCKEQGLHVALETCGYVDYKKLAPLLPFLDLVIYDLKAVDPSLHRRLTGRDSALILQNLERLLSRDVSKIRVRVPLVPGLTATERNLADIIRFLRTRGVSEVSLVPYHRMGESKLARIDSVLQPLSLSATSEEDLASASALFRGEGIEIVD